LARGWLVPPKDLKAIRYAAAMHLEDARDLEERDPAASAWQVAKAVEGMLEYAFASRGLFIPRAKDLFRCARELDPKIGEAAAMAMVAETQRDRSAHAESLAACTIGASGFYEWESEPEDV
jgi:hypothetical protein